MTDSDWNDAPCSLCGETIGLRSMGGPTICAACDCGICRYCHQHWGFAVLGDHIDGGHSLRRLRAHVANCKTTHLRRAAFMDELRRVVDRMSATNADGQSPQWWARQLAALIEQYHEPSR